MAAWLAVVLAVIALAAIALVVVVFIRQTADPGSDCGVGGTVEHLRGEHGVDEPDEHAGWEEAGCRTPSAATPLAGTRFGAAARRAMAPGAFEATAGLPNL